MAEGEIWCEPALMRDVGYWFAVRNEPTVRAVSRHWMPLNYDVHRSHYRRSLYDPKCRLQILYIGGREGYPVRIGYVRLDRREDATEIGIALWPWAQGRGWGGRAIEVAKEWVAAEGWPPLKAIVKCRNLASVRAFLHAGFEIEGQRWLSMRERVKGGGEYVRTGASDRLGERRAQSRDAGRDDRSGGPVVRSSGGSAGGAGGVDARRECQ